MVYEGNRQPMLVSLAVRRARVPSNAIHHSLRTIQYGTLKVLSRKPYRSKK